MNGELDLYPTYSPDEKLFIIPTHCQAAVSLTELQGNTDSCVKYEGTRKARKQVGIARCHSRFSYDLSWYVGTTPLRAIPGRVFIGVYEDPRSMLMVCQRHLSQLEKPLDMFVVFQLTCKLVSIGSASPRISLSYYSTASTLTSTLARTQPPVPVHL